MQKISRYYRSVKFPVCALSLFLFCLSSAHAAEPPPGKNPEEPRPQLWLTTGFLSHHFKRDAGYNEQNTGIGLEIRLNDNNAVAAGIYRNSVRKTTRYLQYAWTPLHWGQLRLGATAGVINNYPELNNGKAALALMPVAAFDFKLLSHDAGVNIVYIPTIAQRVDGALALQLRFRVH